MWAEFESAQARQLVDVQQVFEVWRRADYDRRHRYSGSMHWKVVDGHEYLYRKYDYRRSKSLGRRAEGTEAIERSFLEGLHKVKETLASSSERINEMAPVNKALRINRVPFIAARILRKLDSLDLLGRQVSVVGTHALYAYESLAAVTFRSELLATGDVDLLYDARRRLKLRAEGLKRVGLLGVLRQVDKSFSSLGVRSYRAANKQGFLVDLIAPASKNIHRSEEQRLGGEDDLVAAEMRSLVWLQSVPSVQATAIDERGFPLRIEAPHPLAFTAYKRWLSRQHDREPLKRGRDLAQAEAVSSILDRLVGTVPEFTVLQLPGPLRPFAKLAVTGKKERLKLEPSW